MKSDRNYLTYRKEQWILQCRNKIYKIKLLVPGQMEDLPKPPCFNPNSILHAPTKKKMNKKEFVKRMKIRELIRQKEERSN